MKRLINWTGKSVGMLLQVLLVCVVIVFAAGSCWKDGKKFLSCTGIYRPDPVKEVQFRPIDPKNEKDQRFVISLLKLASATKIDLDKIRVGIAIDPHINAMTVGSDTFVFCEGLDKLSDEALDAVMAHEVGHAIRNHGDRSSELVNNVNTIARIAGTIVGADEETKDEVSSWAVDVVFAPYSRAQELEADSVAVELLKNSGYPLNGVEVMCNALDSISKQEPDTGRGFLSTHPSIPERILSIRKNSKNVSGPLTKEQYWPAMGTIMLSMDTPYELVRSGLKERVQAVGERIALDDFVKRIPPEVKSSETLVRKLRAIIPPPAYAKMHARFILMFEALQTALETKFDAAKKRDLKRALALEVEANRAFTKDEEFLKQMISEAKKYWETGN